MRARTSVLSLLLLGVLLACGGSSDDASSGSEPKTEAPVEEPTEDAASEEVVPAELIGRYEASVPMTAHAFGRGKWEITVDQNDFNGILDATRVTPLRFTAEEKAQIEKTKEKGGVSGLEELGNHISEQFVAANGTVSFPEGTVGCSAPASYAYSLKGKTLTWKTVDEGRPCQYRTFLFEVAWTKVSDKP